MIGEVEHIISINNSTGEGPVWDPENQILYWVDIPGNAFFTQAYNDGKIQKYELDCPVGVLRLCESGRLVMATKKGIGLYDLKKRTINYLHNPLADKPHMRFNDGATDQQGRFWAGTMLQVPEDDKTGEGILYRLDPDGSLHEMEHGLFLSNGIGWSPDQRTMYLTDTTTSEIFAYDFDKSTGNISNRRIFVKQPENEGFPDGLTVDSEGYIWSAAWSGWKMIRYDPHGNKVAEIKFPTQCITCCVFGGPELQDMYITSATSGLNSEQIEQQPWAGDLFRVRTDIKGKLQPKFNDTALTLLV